jgi:hypothetical protein
MDTNLTNDEIRMSNVEGMTKPKFVGCFCETPWRLAQTPYNLFIRICFVIRHSDFVIYWILRAGARARLREPRSKCKPQHLNSGRDFDVLGADDEIQRACG